MATTLTSTPNVTSPSFLDTKPLGEEKHNVLTELNYWKRLDNPLVSIDFSTPGAQDRYNELSKLDEAHKVLIHDVRGKESKYTLERNGFQYVQHDVREVKDWSNHEQVQEVLVPASEALVKQV
jgi:hypothetical protein